MPVAPPLPSARSQSSEESRAILQRRLGAFFGCTSALLLFFLVSQAATHLPALLRLGTAAEMRTAYLADAALILLCAAIFVACRRAHLNEGTLGTLDVAGFFAIAAGTVCVSLSNANLFDARISPLIGGVFLILSRAGIVPSTGRRTAIASFGCAIIFAVGVIPLRPIEGHGPLHDALSSFRLHAGAALVATFTSHSIYGLRRQVEEARRLGQYVLEELIGQGGMGRVYRARHALLRRDTAIKLLLPEQVGEAALLRFEHEVQATARLTHPSTVAVYDYGRTPEGVFYYAMEHLDGGDLDDLVAYAGALPAGRVVFILEQV
jgi:hypothetical protein